jgi:hypothetical protein
MKPPHQPDTIHPGPERPRRWPPLPAPLAPAARAGNDAGGRRWPAFPSSSGGGFVQAAVLLDIVVVVVGIVGGITHTGLFFVLELAVLVYAMVRERSAGEAAQ